jgi:small redox-active disulfide protein 2
LAQFFKDKEGMIMKMVVYGAGCQNCKKLYELAEIAAKEIGLEYEIKKVEDINEMAEAGVMITPALSLDGKVVISGKVPSVKDLKSILQGEKSSDSKCSCNCSCC